MRARARRCHAAAHRAVEGVLEEKDLDPELTRRVLVEDSMRGVGVVVIADAGVVAADDEVRAPVVAPHDGVEHRFLGTRIAHPGRVGAEQDTRTDAGMAALFVSPTSGCSSSPSMLSSATFCRYS